MRHYNTKTALRAAVFAITALLLLAGMSFAQPAVNLTASRQSVTMPDGNTVPMWGWSCSSAVAPATCTTLTCGGYITGSTMWQPPLITIPTGQGLTVNLTNNLPVETSFTIVGPLVGGGLGQPVRESAPRNHPTQTVTTWTNNIGATFTPPAQGARVRSFVPEALGGGGTQTYSWAAGAIPPGTYLLRTGTYPSIQGPMGLYGVLVVTQAPTLTGGTLTPGTAYTNISYDADVPVLLSEIDPVQNTSADLAAQSAGFDETKPWTPSCGQSYTCYPPAVDFTPLYYLVNGVSFDATAATSSAIPVPAARSTGNVLLRLVNAGNRMHMPSVNGLNMSLIAEDANVIGDVKLGAAKVTPNLDVRVQSDVFMPAGKVEDVIVHPSASGGSYSASTFLVFDRALALSANAFRHDSGMQTMVSVAGGVITPRVTAMAVADNYIIPPNTTSFTGNVLNNDVGVSNASPTGTFGTCAVQVGAQQFTTSGGNTVMLSPNGSFVWTAKTGSTGLAAGATDTFSYCGDGNSSNPNMPALVTFNGATLGNPPVANADTYTSNNAALMKINAPGVLANDTDPTGYPLSVAGGTTPPLVLDGTSSGLTVTMKADGGFTAIPSTATGGSYWFCYHALNSQGTPSQAAGNPGGSACPTVTVGTTTVQSTQVSLNFLAPNGPKVTLYDPQAQQNLPIVVNGNQDYKWIIEQDLTFLQTPQNQVNQCAPSNPACVPMLGTSFHTSYMPVIASGCTGPQSCEQNQTMYDANPSSPTYGQHVPAVCDGSGICVPAPTGSFLPVSTPDQVNLPQFDQSGNQARYYISVLPGDSVNPTVYGTAGHTMGGSPINPSCSGSVCTSPATIVNVEPSPLPTATVTIDVFEDDWPLNGEPDTGGGVDVYPTQEPSLGDFQVEIWDDAGGSGDATGQMTYDQFNMPLTNSLNGQIDPLTGLNACPLSPSPIMGTIIVCPQFESDGETLSPLTGQAVVRNLMPGRFGIIVHPGAEREARGEEWVQTNTLDGTHYLDAFVKAGEPAYFQEFGPGGFHVFMGMANPAIINSRLSAICNGLTAPGQQGPPSSPPACNNTVNGQVTNLHQARSPIETLFSNGVFPQGDPRNYKPLSYTTCYAAIGDTDGATIAFTKCDQNGNFSFSGLPDGDYGLVIFDQWLDLIVDGSSKAVSVRGGQTINLNYAAFTWQTHLWTRTYMDTLGNGAPTLLGDGITLDPATSPGLIQVPNRIRMRNGKFNNALLSDMTGSAHFDETFPLFNWYVIESDTTRFRGTGVHVVNDAGGQVDGPASGGMVAGNGTTGPYQGILSSVESFSLPNNLRYPGSVYCALGDAQCATTNLSTNPTGGGPGGSTGRIDPGSVVSEGWEGGLGEFDLVDWGKQPYVKGETGGIKGHVVYASTRPFDDPQMLFQNLWEPLVPNVTLNLYQQTTAPDGTNSLKLVDTVQSSSWDAWAQGFRADGNPNMNCPGQATNDPFFSFTMQGTEYYLSPGKALPANSQFKCFDGYHNLNQMQPAPYDGMYQFPSPYCAQNPGSVNPATGLQCITVSNPAYGAPLNVGAGAVPGVLPAGLYVVEAIPPQGYETVKEEDKNILIGDAFIAPVTQQFGAISNIFIVPDQASLNAFNPSYTGAVTCANGCTVTAVAVTNPGSGYTSVPTVTIAAPNPPAGTIITTATASATLGVVSVNVTNGGSGYTSVPNVTITGDGTGAAATATVLGGVVTSIQVSGGGDNYTSVPTVTIDPPGGSGTLATAAASLGVASITNLNGGDGYSGNPSSVTIAGGGGTGATAAATVGGSGLALSDQNPGNPTQSLGRTTQGDFGPGGLIVQSAPCVGALRIVPDFMSISPESGQVAPFAGVSRHLCDRKLVTLNDSMQADADFFIWTKTPASSHTTGIITDDFSSEFDPSSPAFGEKFAVPNLPVSFRDYNGVETSRVYSDAFGDFDGLTYSTWEVNPPNPTGYAPNMMVTCMNDPGPIPDPNHPGQTMIDPLYNSNYSDFCYENPYMPADTDYLDTPVVPTSAFAEAYNPPDCAYPDTTPAIASVLGDTLTGGGQGPWVAATGNTLTINALGDQLVPNYAYSGPAASTPPYNQKFVTRHYGFGATQGTGTVTIGGVAATVSSWSDMQIVVTAPANVPACNMPPGYTGTVPQCGELVITAGNGKQSIDTVTVTIGGTANQAQPTYLASGQTIQSAIDAANPGDMIIIPAGTYNEMLLMWKPIRLQGVGAASVTVNANSQPAGLLLDPWRRKVDCLFGLALNGGFLNYTNNGQGQAVNPYDPTGTYSCPFYSTLSGQLTSQSIVDPLLLEPVQGWDASLNGNIAELLQEPSLMGAYEGGAITVLAKGLENNNSTNCSPVNSGGCIPLNALTGADPATNDCNPQSPFYLSNYQCNPSRIDGMSFVNSSQGGGGVFLHGWNHYTEVSNNRVHSNGGTLGGGIIVGQAESSEVTFTNGIGQPFLLQTNVNVHNNSITQNSSYGDELNSATPASAAGAIFCTGSDYYKFQYNWVCGNIGSGDGGGFAHQGFIWNGDIEHNWFLFNQSTNPTLPTHGGGVIIQGQLPDGSACENSAIIDFDCPPALADGAGPNLVINANLFQGNTAESGNGGGLRLQEVNGNDVVNNTGGPGECFVTSSPVLSGAGSYGPGATQCHWYQEYVTNNVFVDNVAGWSGGGLSLNDSLLVNFINNTVASNDTTASAGVLFDTSGASLANVPPPGCNPGTGVGCTNPITTSQYEPAGLATEPIGLNLSTAWPAGVTCPAAYPNCNKFSNPALANNVFWQNRAFYITVTAQPGLQSTVLLNPALTQSATGSCPTTGANGGSGPFYWDIGVYGDTQPGPNTSTGLAMNPLYSILDDPGYDPSNKMANPSFASQYCNGSRVPPEIVSQLCNMGGGAIAPGCIPPGSVGVGMIVPAGVPDASNSTPAFGLAPAATVDEGNNWINLFYGPLSLSNATQYVYNTNMAPLGNYSLNTGSPAIDAIPASAPTYSIAPTTDFFGNPRPDHAGSQIDMGAIEALNSLGPAASIAPTALNFGNQDVNTTSSPLTVTLSNSGDGALTIHSIGISGTNPGDFAISNNPCGSSLAAGASCVISMTFTPSAQGARSASLTISSNDPTSPTLTVSLSGIGVEPLISVQPGSLAFGSQVVNTTSSAQSVTVSNTGTAALAFGAITTSSGFAVSANTCGASLAAGGQCTISVTFTPTAVHVYNGTLTINSNAFNAATTSVTLSGTGISALSISPSSLSFASQIVSTTSASQTVTLKNIGGSTITGLSESLTGANAGDFIVSHNTCGSTLSVNQTCSFNVQFHPSAIGSRTASITVTSSDPASPQTIGLSGTGVALGFSPNPVLFTNVQVGTTGTIVVTVTNPSSAPLGIGSTQVSGSRFGETRGGDHCSGQQLAANGGTCTVSVTFSPNNTSQQNGSLTVNFAGGGNAAVTLSGQGVQGNATFNPSPVAFHTVSRGQALTISVTVTNSGTAPLIISSTLINGNNEFSKGTDTCAGHTIAVSGTCSIAVTFRPTHAGSVTGVLRVNDNGPGGNQQDNLTGTGR